MKQPNKSHYDKWNEANPIRTATITKKVAASKLTKFQPYLDGGLTANNSIIDIQKFIPDFTSVTLAFIQQAADVTDKLFLTIAAISSTSIPWTDNLLAENVYKPLVKSKKLQEMVIAFGGANASKSTNPWSVALKITNNDEQKARKMLKNAFLDYIEHITKLGEGNKEDYPKYLDFDLEGQSLVTDLPDIKFLIETLADMKKDNELNIFEASLTLPVLPTGLTHEGLAVVNVLVKIWNNVGLDLNACWSLEDAKEIYNWAHKRKLGVIRTWSFNDDVPIDMYGSENKSLFCHGLNYLLEYDFAKALSGNWDELVQNPYTSPNQPLVSPIPKDIKQYINKTYLGDIYNNSSDFLLEQVNKLNNCNFTYKDIKITEITDYQAHLIGRVKYKGNVYISFSHQS